MGNKKCPNGKHDHDRVIESEIREWNKQRMMKWWATFKEPQEETVGQTLVDPAQIESDVENFLASLLNTNYFNTCNIYV